jgi:hypothetical protein
MPVAEILIPAVTSLIIQGIQTWIELGRAAGQTEEQIDAAFIAAKTRFDSKKAADLPDA